MAASVIGYVGCFSLIQAGKRIQGPLIWLGIEVALCSVRLLVAIWAWNPSWDDPPPPIALRKVQSTKDGEANLIKGNTVTYDVSWTLDDVTADDMHAFVVGIDHYDSPAIPPLHCAVSDAKNDVDYLRRSGGPRAPDNITLQPASYGLRGHKISQEPCE